MIDIRWVTQSSRGGNPETGTSKWNASKGHSRGWHVLSTGKLMLANSARRGRFPARTSQSSTHLR